MESKHTPTPWKDYGVFNQINGSDHSFICQFQKKVDKDFVLLACNSHAALVEALEQINSWASDCGSSEGKKHLELIGAKCREISETALKLAKGE